MNNLDEAAGRTCRQSAGPLVDGVGAVGNDAAGRVADIVGRARERNLDRAEELAGWVTAGAQGELTTQDRSVAAEVAHQLAGSAGTFGYQMATELAREIEQFFADDAQQSWQQAGDCVRDLIRRLHESPEGGAAAD